SARHRGAKGSRFDQRDRRFRLEYRSMHISAKADYALRALCTLASGETPRTADQLARPPEEITVGEVFRRLEGPLAEVRGLRPEAATYGAAAANLQTIWVAVRACLREVLDEISIADVVSGRLPKHVSALVAKPDAWQPR